MFVTFASLFVTMYDVLVYWIIASLRLKGGKKIAPVAKA